MADSNMILKDYAELEVNLYNKNHDAAMVVCEITSSLKNRLFNYLSEFEQYY